MLEENRVERIVKNTLINWSNKVHYYFTHMQEFCSRINVRPTLDDVKVMQSNVLPKY